MSIPINTVAINGWVAAPPERNSDGTCSFLLFQHRYHETFRAAQDDLTDGLLVQVNILLGTTADECRTHLRRGHRVTISGQLQPIYSKDHGCSIGISAHQIERSEALESLRYINHPWNELRAVPALGSTQGGLA